VISKTAVERRTKWQVRRSTLAMGDDLRRLRVDAGVTLRELADITGIDASHIARIEKGTTHASVRALTALAIALGADMSVRFFAGSGPRIHDRFQAPMLESTIRSLASCWQPGLEVVVPGPRRGIADIVLTHRQIRSWSSARRSPSSVGSSSRCVGWRRRPRRSRTRTGIGPWPGC
jgi:transcriptional regulator with XRE-family HTH domain